MAPTLAQLKTKRASSRGALTRIKTFVETADNPLVEELECRLSLCEAYFKQLVSIQDQIDNSEEATEGDKNMGGELDDLYCSIKARLLAAISERKRRTSTPLSPDNTIASSTQLVTVTPSGLPKFKLPTFSGGYAEYTNFINSFKLAVSHYPNLTNLEKFLHLRSCLTGDAIKTIAALEITDANYKEALELLANRYGNKYIIFQTHIQKLFEAPTASKGTGKQLTDVIDNINVHLHALRSLAKDEIILDSILVYIAKKKLDVSTTNKWEESLNYNSLPTWKEFTAFINSRCQCLTSQETPKNSSSVTPNSRKPKSSFVAARQSCLKCNSSDHSIHKCQNFANMPVLERFKEIKRLGLCVNCLSKGHSVKHCRSSRCRICASPHHSMLHRFSSQSSSSFTQNQPSNTPPCQPSTLSPAPGSNTSLHSAMAAYSDQVILATAMIYIKDKFGSLVPTRVLLDSASQLNFISESLVSRLQLKRNRIDAEISGIGDLVSKVKFATTIKVKSRINDFTTQAEAMVLSKITGVHPEANIDIQGWDIPENVSLADPQFNVPQRVDLLLGAEIFYQLLGVGQIKLGPELPLLQKTIFGWIVAGKFKATFSHREFGSLVVNHSDQELLSESTLQKQVERFWKIEEVGGVAPEWSVEQRKCEEHFSSTTTRDSDGRFIVRLPFKQNPQALGRSYDAAIRSLSRLETKFGRNPALKQQYVDFMQEYEHLHHMELARVEAKYFIPHRCVLRPDSSTTKLRVGFNASCPTDTNISLNDILMVGPVIQEDLYAVLTRFRLRKYTVTADISKMYRQIRIAHEDQAYLGILWRENDQDPVKTYFLSTVTYGTSCAPYQATRCLKALADEHATTHPIGSKAIQHDFYVDDMISGADSLEELFQLKHQVQTILSSAKFELRKWSSNNKEFLETIPTDQREETRNINDTDVVKTLGLIWNPTTDKFQFNWSSGDHLCRKITKRTILAIASSLFDPLGLISPIIVLAKMILQELWSLKLAWDEALPMDLHQEWENYYAQLQDVSKIVVPRHLYSSTPQWCELHGFADASIKAYGCCLYLRCVSTDGHIQVRLISSKSRVAPLKTQSLPRLELCAALLFSQLVHRLVPLIKPVDRTILWTDSEIGLYWIYGEANSWTTFVANRVSQIQQLTDTSWWRHVDSKSNPADIVSRGCPANALSSSIWFVGPSFLQEPEERWPSNCKFTKIIDIPEKRKCRVLKLELLNPQLDLVASNKFINQYAKLLRIFAWALRFCGNVAARLREKGLVIKLSSSSNFSSNLTPEEIKESQRRILFVVQAQAFGREIKSLAQNKPIERDSRLKSLCPFLDEGSPRLLRVGGRLKDSNLPVDVKFPILLPKGHPLSISYLIHLHKKLFHAGSQALVAASRQVVWIINVKEAANQVVRKCVHCFHYRPKTLQQVMGNLPPERISYSPPFTNTGVDFCGPIWISSRIRGRPLQKAYIALFICFATKAVHLEVVSDLSADSFILALKRFIARRGKCSTLFCDNATNFIGAQSKLCELHQTLFNEEGRRKILQTCTDDMIAFRFIPPRSPHFGGLWESTIKSAKHHLYRAMHNSSFSFEELATVTAQIEAILNSRPISALSADPNDHQALTPGHFLIGRPLCALAEPDQTQENISSLKRWAFVCAVQQHFWKRWLRDYIPQLQQRYKWNAASPDVKVNTLVLVADDQQPPQKWIMGRIIETHPGSDGHTRVVDVKTQHGILRRSIQKLAPLPFQNLKTLMSSRRPE